MISTKDKPVYVFIKLDEDGITIEMTNNLDDFRKFNHYGFIPHEEHLIELKEKGITMWRGNDTWYSILQHNSWCYMNLELDIKIKSFYDIHSENSFSDRQDDCGEGAINRLHQVQ